MAGFALPRFMSCPFAFALAVLGIPSGVFWPYFAGLAILVIGLPAAIKNAARHTGALDKLVQFGPLLFAIPMAIFGADHFIAAKFVATAVPSWMPWHLFWAYLVGTALIAAALSIAVGRYAFLASSLLATMIFLFVLMIHVPASLATPFEKTRFTILLRDSALSAGVAAFAASHTVQWRARSMHWIITVARVVIAIAIVVFGVDHFLNPTFAPGIPQENAAISVIMPAWIPAHAFWAYATGAIFIICGLSLLIPKLARSAAMVLGITVLVLILFVYVPLTIAKASDIANGLNYLAIHFALAGAALLLAGALPKVSRESAGVAEQQTAGLRRASEV
ncbi:MAG TPA: hypothetical protein VLY23_12600 [Candidatus Acidoferrum sp.]|nr:hypothetical protein [Candidatus Acidoferrum sp.]